MVEEEPKTMRIAFAAFPAAPDPIGAPEKPYPLPFFDVSV